MSKPQRTASLFAAQKPLAWHRDRPGLEPQGRWGEAPLPPSAPAQAREGPRATGHPPVAVAAGPFPLARFQDCSREGRRTLLERTRQRQTPPQGREGVAKFLNQGTQDEPTMPEGHISAPELPWGCPHIQHSEILFFLSTNMSRGPALGLLQPLRLLPQMQLLSGTQHWIGLGWAGPQPSGAPCSPHVQ